MNIINLFVYSILSLYVCQLKVSSNVDIYNSLSTRITFNLNSAQNIFPFPDKDFRWQTASREVMRTLSLDDSLKFHSSIRTLS